MVHRADIMLCVNPRHSLWIHAAITAAVRAAPEHPRIYDARHRFVQIMKSKSQIISGGHCHEVYTKTRPAFHYTAITPRGRTLIDVNYFCRPT